MADIAADRLQRLIKGPVLGPDNPQYDAARAIWNGMFDRRPALIAQCAEPVDVVETIRFARDVDLPVCVRSGGHGVGGHAVIDGRLMIDLSHMKRIAIDPERRVARAQAGALLGDLDNETLPFGLVVPAGVVTHTGLAGLTLGGGIGWVMRKYGLTADNLISLDVVTADGRTITASADEHPDLFWGLRGGGGNFGIVTSFEFALRPLGPDVLAGLTLHPADRAGEALRFYRDFVAQAPDELGTIVNLRHAPPAPFIPEHAHGKPVLLIAACYAGPIDEGEAALEPLRSWGTPIVDAIERRRFIDFQGLFDASVPHGHRYYWKSEYLGPLSDDAIDALTEHAWQAPSPKSYAIMFHMGGAVRQLDEADTAFHGRAAEHSLNINGAWVDPAGDAQEIAWTRDFWTAMQPHAEGVYVNFLGDEGAQRVREAYGPEKYDRLVSLKRTYDPDNFFDANQNISPEG